MQFSKWKYQKETGFSVIAAAKTPDGKAIVKMPVLPHLTHAEENPRVAGGVIMSLLDYTIHHALDSLLNEYE